LTNSWRFGATEVVIEAVADAEVVAEEVID
jgi:hypothetical protein